MNERIKNLVKQTARELVYEHDDDIGGVMDVWKFQDKDIEKFAELIVRECLEQIYSVTVDNSTDDWDQGYNSGLYQAAETIKTHFGVEE